MTAEFPHRHAAHCENGVTANLLTWAGLEVSEPLVFGIGGGLFFGYFPFIRVNHLPLVTYRSPPGSIFRRVTRRLGVEVGMRRFRDPRAAADALDAELARGRPVGLQTGMYWLPYIPPAYRFHFNAHNIVVYGKDRGAAGDAYRISDPVLEEPVTCAAADLQRARFAAGALAPRGRMYWLTRVAAAPQLAPAARAGIRDVCRLMAATPVPLVGARGIRLLARRLRGWPRRLGQRRAALHLGHVIRMQEEIGTGGGGFRFLYAAFLQEAAGLPGLSGLAPFAERMTAVGDRWREFALLGSRVCKGRHEGTDPYEELAAILIDCAAREQALFRDLAEAVA